MKRCHASDVATHPRAECHSATSRCMSSPLQASFVWAVGVPWVVTRGEAMCDSNVICSVILQRRRHDESIRIQSVYKLRIWHITFRPPSRSLITTPHSAIMHRLFSSLLLLATLISPCLSAPVDVPLLFTTLRHSTASDLPSLLTAVPHPPSHPELLNMGFPSTTLHTTSSSRLILPTPRFHHLTYIIPHPSAPYSELLVASSLPDGKVRLENFGWISGYRWDTSAPRRDLAIKLGEGRYLLADDVPVGGFGVTKAPWSDEIGGGKEGYRWLGGRWEADVGGSNSHHA